LETLNDPAYMPPGRADVTELMVNEFFLHLLKWQVMVTASIAIALHILDNC